MRSIYEIIEEMDKHSQLFVELDDNLSAVQTIFSNFNDHIKPFRNIQIIQENERYLSELKNRVQSFFKKNGFLLPDDTLSKEPAKSIYLRKITLFLIYITDSSANGVLESAQNVCHLLNIPKIPKCVLFYCLQELELFPYFCDFVQYAPTSVVSAYLDSELIKSMDVLRPTVRMEYGLNLLNSLYHHCWFSAFESNMDMPKEMCLENVQEFLSVLLLEILQVERSKLPNCKTLMEFDIYLGNLLKGYFPVLNGCLRASLSGTLGEYPSLFQLYQLDNERRLLTEQSDNEFSKNLIKSVNNLLLNRLQVVLVAVTVRTFYNWVEEDVSKTVTLQRAVGELANELYQLITENEILDHKVKAGLQTICVKPLNLVDLTKNANIRELIENVEDQENKDRGAWMAEFLLRGELVFGNEECIKVLAENTNLITVGELESIISFLTENVGNDEIMATELFQIILEVLANSSVSVDVVSFLDLQQPFRLIVEFDVETDVYFQELTEFFNKLVDLPESPTTLIGPFIKCLAIDPERTLRELQSYCISDTNQLANVLKMLELVKGFSSAYLDIIVQSLLESFDSKNPYKGLEVYVTTLFSHGFLEQQYFVKDTLFPEILRKSKDKEKAAETLILLEILKGIFATGKYQPDADVRAPLLIGLGQVADAHRWDLASYTDTEERIVSLCVALISVIGTTSQLEGKHKSFIAYKSQSLKELNRYYMDQVCQEEGAKLDFVNYLHPGTFKTDKNRKEFLCKMFVRATLNEKRMLTECVDLQPFLLDTMFIITKAVAGNDKLSRGFQGTFLGFLKIFKDELLETEHDNSLFLDIVAILPVDFYLEHSFVVNDICVKIVQKADPEGDRERLKGKIEKFPESPAKSHLLEQILATTQ